MKQTLSKKSEWPKTVEEAADEVIAAMSRSFRDEVAGMKKDDLIMLHHGFGTAIRNRFGLWRGNESLMKDAGADHPDRASMIIIEKVWKKLGGRNVRRKKT